MVKHWEDNGPPVYIAVAGYLGLIKERRGKGKKQSPKKGDLNDLVKMFQGTGGRIQ